MKPRIWFLLVPLLLISPCPAAAPGKAPGKPAVVAAKPGDPAAIDRLTIRQRRDMGLTVSNITRVARSLKQAGEPVTAAAIRDHLAGENPKAYAVQAPNWENILAFIERLLPLILKLIDLFGAVTPAGPAHLIAPDMPILAQYDFAACSPCSGGRCAVPVVVEVRQATVAVASHAAAVPRRIVGRWAAWRPVRRVIGR